MRELKLHVVSSSLSKTGLEIEILAEGPCQAANSFLNCFYYGSDITGIVKVEKKYDDKKTHYFDFTREVTYQNTIKWKREDEYVHEVPYISALNWKLKDG